LNYQKRALEDNPNNTDFLENIALTQRRLGLWEEAIDNFLFAAKLAPDNLSIITSTAETLNMSRDIKRLALFLKTVRKRFPDIADLAAIAAELVLRTEGDLEKAQKLFQGITPNSGRVYVVGKFELSWLKRSQSESEIIDVLNRPEVITFLERFPAALEYGRGLAYHVYGKNKLANIEFNKIISLVDETQLSGSSITRAVKIIYLAVAKILQGDTDSGIVLARQALDILSYDTDKADGVMIDNAVGYVLALAGERDEALEMIERLLDTPGGYNRWYLYLDPRWDFFRDDERFNKLIKPLNYEQSTYFKNKSANETEQK
jgi:tetratricopeptide (TPR) repeat protein